MMISETAIFVTSLLMTSLTAMVATQSSDDISSDEAHAFDTESVCPGWYYSGLHCYRLFTYEFVYSDRTWMTASSQCRTHGGRLVSINSANEAFAVNNMLQSFGSKLFVWIGLSDHQTEGRFQWIDGSNVTYTSWDDDEPTSGPDVTNIDAHIQDYVISNNNRWRDVPNDWTALIDGVFQPSGFVCEKEVENWPWHPLMKGASRVNRPLNSTSQQNVTLRDEVLTARSSADIDEVNKLSTNSSVFDKVASKLSDELLAALAWSARASTPRSDQINIPTDKVKITNRSSTSQSRRSWELFLAEVVSNLSSEAKADRRQTTSPATSTTLLSSDGARPAILPSIRSTSREVAKQLQQQLSAVRSRNLPRQSRPQLPHAPLNLKSPPAARLDRLQVSTDNPPPSRSWKPTNRLRPLTTPPVYLRHVQPPVTSVDHRHHHHHHHTDVHHRRVGSLRLNSPHNNTLWSTPANQMSAASLFRILGLWTGNDVNMTSSSVTVADMMRYVLLQATRLFSSDPRSLSSVIQGLRGPPGPPGPPGPRGPPGPAGSPVTQRPPSTANSSGTVKFNASSIISWIVSLTGGRAAAAGVAPLPAAVSSRLQSALTDQQPQQHHKEAMMRDLQQTVSTGRRFIIGHTVALAGVFVSLVGLMLYTRRRWRQRRLDADMATDCTSNSSKTSIPDCIRI